MKHTILLTGLTVQDVQCARDLGAHVQVRGPGYYIQTDCEEVLKEVIKALQLEDYEWML